MSFHESFCGNKKKGEVVEVITQKYFLNNIDKCIYAHSSLSYDGGYRNHNQQ